MVEKTKGMKEEVVTREYTINLHKRLRGIRRSRFLCLNNIPWISLLTNLNELFKRIRKIKVI
ncbi:putative ribosomal protein L31e domain superfamily [Helianthus annuus]|uniref:Ribosomal protein L31e n=1 Tax=Helianthus annuus TaxID=4232 RepID=A0A9K3H3C9_HELAN|nr:putative ribosomal protein L31e [Helianthus annuus]KAJ0451262.1 putative ribosomal protein L31e domain superfamily [Helianthus annuus]KAJ0455725.1 putative ribosomal protein L31e domain superfamily [Helianthus annuus]KAJ0473131.1 putative ribosomal protein L31e domain superfamily [Helianthus annuus]KAJ0648733.1 putative ribosomal protein L31e domain superfamily [Helianthus annuus]